MKEIVLFVSSTFSDMIDERELLVRSVFPRVKRFCKEKGLIFRTIDLRWGITQKQADDLKQTIDICLRRVNDSVPLFLSFIGQRYGWIPSDEYFDALRCDHPEVVDQYKGRSATELEIMQALYFPFYDGSAKRCLFFLKNPSYLETIPDESIKDKYIEETEDGKNKLNRLRQYLIDENLDCSEYTSEFIDLDVPSYLEKYDTAYSGGLVQTNFECEGLPLADKLYEKLIDAIMEVSADVVGCTPLYQGENDQKYLLNRYRYSTPVDSVDSYLASCLDAERGRFHGLYMPEFQGKSSALARFILFAQKKSSWVFYRFLGEESNIKTIKGVLHTLAEEICARFDQPFIHEGGHIYDLTVVQKCLNILFERGESSVIVLDGLNKTTNTYAEWLDFFGSLSAGHIIFSTNNQDVRIADAPYFDSYQSDEFLPIIRYHFEQYGKNIADEHAKKLLNIARGKLVNIMHIIRYLIRFSTFESIGADMDRLGGISHLDAIVSMDDEYSKLQPLCVHWNEHYQVLQHILSYTTYTLMICRSGVTFEELSEIIFDVVSKLNGGMERNLLDEYINFELQLLSEELNDTNGIYSIKDPFYADYLICELNRSCVMRRFYFECVVDHFCRFAASDKGCPRHFFTINEILENITAEELDHFLTQYYFKHEYLESMINTMGYSYLMKCMERYYVQSLGYLHPLANTPENRYQIRRLLKKMPTPQNEIGLIRKLFMLVPIGFRNKHAAAFSYIAYLMRCNGFDQRPNLPIVTAFYSVVSSYPADQYKQHSVCLKMDDRCSYQKDKTTVYLDVLYACGMDDRAYAYNLASGECETVIQLQKGDEGLCLFYFETQIFIVGRRLLYLWDTVHNTKAVFDYVKNMQSAVKDVSVSRNGDVAFWFENGLIKLYRRMQPLFEIDCFVGSNIEHVWTKEINGNMITVVLVKGQGYYIFKNERELFPFGSDIKDELRSEKYAGINGNDFYYAISHEKYATMDLINFENRTMPLTIQCVLKLECENVITADENARITVNGNFTGLNHSVAYTELVDDSLYLIDNEGNLRIC